MFRRFLSLCLLFPILITGCQSAQPSPPAKDLPSKKEFQKQKTKDEKKLNKVQAYETTQDAFHSAGDWVDHEHILIAENEKSGTNIYLYNIFSGLKTLFYHTEAPLISMKSNGAGKFMLHTSPSDERARLTVLDTAGELLYEWESEASELEYSWNPYNEDQLLCTVFLEDWSYLAYLIDIGKSTAVQLENAGPLMQWIGPESMGYLDWKSDESTESAPFYSYHFPSKQKALLGDGILSFGTFKDIFFTADRMDGPSSITYRFYKPGDKTEFFVLKVPVQDVQTIVQQPFYAFSQEGERFLTFKPADGSNGFKLVSISVKDGDEEEILPASENMPIKLSPDGKWCLYGFQYENVINMETHDIVSLIQFNQEGENTNGNS